jgi:hypothetical protein
MWATHKNPTAKILREQIEWELEALRKVKEKVSKTMKAVQDFTKNMRKHATSSAQGTTPSRGAQES